VELIRCADASLAAGEQLAGTGMVARRWLCVESRQQWGHDAIATGFPDDVTAWLAEVDAKVLAIRRPGLRERLTVFAATTAEGGSTLRHLAVDDLRELEDVDPWAAGEEVAGPLFLVCAHGRRDACCSRLGIPVFHALEAVAGTERVWQCSHTGGHRFAANVVVLPQGATLGRVEPWRAPELVGLLGDGRVPLDVYRGRSVYDDVGQVAEVAARKAHGLDALEGLRAVERDGRRLVFELDGHGRVEALVDDAPSLMVTKSCGGAAETVPAYAVTLA